MHLHVQVRVVAVLSYEFIKRFVHFALILLLIDLVDPSVESLGQKCVNVDIVLFVIDEIPAHVLAQTVNALFVQSRGQTQSDRMRDVMHHLLSLLLEILLSRGVILIISEDKLLFKVHVYSFKVQERFRLDLFRVFLIVLIVV
jgi:hypothetical protein